MDNKKFGRFHEETTKMYDKINTEVDFESLLKSDSTLDEELESYNNNKLNLELENEMKKRTDVEKNETLKRILLDIMEAILDETDFVEEIEDLFDIKKLIEHEGTIDTINGIKIRMSEERLGGAAFTQGQKITFSHTNSMFKSDEILKSLMTGNCFYRGDINTLFHEFIHVRQNKIRMKNIWKKTIESLGNQDRKERGLLKEIHAYRAASYTTDSHRVTTYRNQLRDINYSLAGEVANLRMDEVTDRVIMATQQIDRLRALGISHDEIAALVSVSVWDKQRSLYEPMQKEIEKKAKEKGYEMVDVDTLVDELKIKKRITNKKMQLIALRQVESFLKQAPEPI